MKKLFATLCLIVAWQTSAVAQSTEPNTQPDIIPPSPEAASLGKFAQIPVSYNTGSPQVEIPLYQIAVNDMQIPIGLSCHTTGIKVEEVASWVGLGWTLDAGGAITRVMQGRPDESSFGYFNEVQWAEWQSMKDVALPDLDPNSGSQAADRYYFQKAVAEGQIDLQPDIFYFNFAGYTGRIVFDVHKTPVIIPYQDLKISHPFSESKDWVISTPEGIEYVFKDSDAERTTPLDEGVYIAPFVSTWYLSEVRSKKQPGFITFTYESASLAGIEMRPAQGVILSLFSDPVGKPHPYDPFEDFPEGMSTSEYSITVKYLKRIQFTNGYIEFNSTADRLDKYNKVNYTGRKLNSFIVFGPGPSVVKQVDFIYANPYPSDRLTLESIQETGKTPYRFTYYEGLPAADSYAQDHWGYYNGQTGNKSLIPAMSLDEQASYRPTSSYQAFGSANRSPSAVCVAGTISSITYPTGGKRVFSFEENKITVEEEEGRPYGIIARGDVKNTSMDLYAQGLYNWYNDIQASRGSGLDINVAAMPFHIEKTQFVQLGASISSSLPGAVAEIAQVLLYKVPVDYNDELYFNTNSIVQLQEGDYVMIAASSNPGTYVSGSVYFTKTVYKAVSQGGMRIAEINDYDEEKLIQSQAFKYIKGEEATGSSSRAVRPDSLPPLPPVQQPIPPSSAELFLPVVYKKKTASNRLLISSSNLYHPNTFEGYHIGYKRVEVIQRNFTPGSLANGSTVYIYENNVNDIMRGLLREVVHLNSLGDTVSHAEYIYNYNEGPDVIFFSYAPSVEMEKKRRIYQQCQIGGGPHGSDLCSTVNYFEFEVKDRQYTTFFPYQTRIIEKVFSKEHYPDYLITTTEIKQGKEVPGSYDESHTLPVETIKTSSTGDRIIERFVNSPEVESPGTPDIKVPVRHDVIKESVGGQQYLLSSIQTQYQGNLPVNTQLFETAMPVSYSNGMELVYGKQLVNSYSNQKIVGRRASDGFSTAYLWDSNALYPIAEIKNCTSSQAAYTSFENASGEGGWAFTLNVGGPGKTGRQCHTFVGGVAISKSGLKSNVFYKVTYWARNSVPVVSNVVSSNDDDNAAEDGWKYYEKIISGTTSVTIGSTAGGLIDELRICPVDAFMTSFTYQTGAGVTSRNDPNNKLTFYEYDPAGRLINTRDHDKKRVQNFDYHYRSGAN